MSLAVLIVVAFAIRCSQFGNPLIHVDENFYLLVGDRMLHGALPYVDLWDRKPIGLFLLYAGIRLLGGAGIVQYQVVATLFAAATAFVVSRIAGRIAGEVAATMAGVLYLLLLGVAGGMGGQSPVFYNLFVAGAAMTTVSACVTGASDPGVLWRRGAVAMALIGLALQVKYSAVFEGLFFGLVFLRQAHRTVRRRSAVAAMAAAWIGLALLPTLLAFGYYACIGATRPFVYANFLSILERHGDASAATMHRLVNVAATLILPAIGVVVASRIAKWPERPGGSQAYAFVLTWLAVALFGFVVFGAWFYHYMLPLFVPIAVACAPLFDRRGTLGAVAGAAMLLAGSGAYAVAVYTNRTRVGGVAAMDTMVVAIRPRLTDCLFVYDGDPMLYYLTGSCLPTRYAFAPHLNLQRENGAIGIDPVAELSRIMARHPSVVVDSRTPDESGENPVANRFVRAILRRDYRLVKAVPNKKGWTMIYARRDARPPATGTGMGSARL